MSSNSSKYRFEHEMAPHVDPKWAATFTMELNIRQAAGEEIGAALAEVGIEHLRGHDHLSPGR
ncbi:hypothetical protein HGQ17_02345 [Nesterenkonia sp. MY13]|uniref:Uncharacterized protein n=1 Tax=Nesterenkonia sedimenti TaxID=1463632 RepID=A0A7X8YCR1_9MICC|nr:hypothetical protein [Nesterenkonia sedimenti]NLS08858.1 hypothetical protein [Nesterenkonia sedimenti]